jgi:hypothetical protein
MKVPKDQIVVREVSVDLVLSDPAVTARFEPSEETIFRYSLCLAKGDNFPPIDVFDLGMNYLLADGGHRLEAYRLECIDKIWARVHPGGRSEALIFAAGSNVKHGLLRTNRDKHRVVENVLKHPDLGKMSNNKIAEICAVSQPFVGRVRWQLTCNGFKFESVRVGSNGRQIETANIGQKKPSAKSKAEPIGERSETSASGVGDFTQGVKALAADSCPVKEGPNGLGEAIATPESGSPPAEPEPLEMSPQQSGGVNQVQENGETRPDEPNYPDDPGVLKRLLEQKKAEIVKLQGELKTKDLLIKELLAENRKLKEEVEYLREQLTEDTTV